MLKLDTDTHDIYIDKFSFALQDTNSDKDELQQRIKVLLLTYTGEWFLDRTFGIDYYNEVFVKGKTKEELDDVFKFAIAAERGVASILEYSSNLNQSSRTFSFKIKIKKQDGEVVSLSLSI